MTRFDGFAFSTRPPATGGHAEGIAGAFDDDDDDGDFDDTDVTPVVVRRHPHMPVDEAARYKNDPDLPAPVGDIAPVPRKRG